MDIISLSIDIALCLKTNKKLFPLAKFCLSPGNSPEGCPETPMFPFRVQEVPALLLMGPV